MSQSSRCALGGHEVRAVEQREALLGFEVDGLEAGAFEAGRRACSCPRARLGFAHERGIACARARGRPTRPTEPMEDDRGDAGVDQATSRSTVTGHAGASTRQRGGEDGEHRADGFGREGSPTAAVAAHRLRLEFAEFGVGDATARELRIRC